KSSSCSVTQLPNDRALPRLQTATPKCGNDRIGLEPISRRKIGRERRQNRTAYRYRSLTLPCRVPPSSRPASGRYLPYRAKLLPMRVPRMKFAVLVVVLPTIPARQRTKLIGLIDFYGYGSLDVT